MFFENTRTQMDFTRFRYDVLDNFQAEYNASEYLNTVFPISDVFAQKTTSLMYGKNSWISRISLGFSELTLEEPSAHERRKRL